MNDSALSLLGLCRNGLTKVSAADIITSSDDISAIFITEVDPMAGQENMALTEPVYYILLSLTQPLHGYGIMQKVEEMSRGRLHMAAGTLYGALSSLQEKGWITAADNAADSRRKKYIVQTEFLNKKFGEPYYLMPKWLSCHLFALGGKRTTRQIYDGTKRIVVVSVWIFEEN